MQMKREQTRMTRGTNLLWRKTSVSAAFAVALTLTFASALHAQALPCSISGSPGVECTPVMNMPLYYPSVTFDLSSWSNVTYQSTAAPLPLLTVDGTPTYLKNSSGVNFSIGGNQQMVGNIGNASFGRAAIRANVNNQGVLSAQGTHNACAPVAADAA